MAFGIFLDRVYFGIVVGCSADLRNLKTMLGALVGSSVRRYMVRYFFPSGTACAVMGFVLFRRRQMTAAAVADQPAAAPPAQPPPDDAGTTTITQPPPPPE